MHRPARSIVHAKLNNEQLAAVDAQRKSDHDEPSVGLMPCKTKNGVVVEYALPSVGQLEAELTIEEEEASA